MEINILALPVCWKFEGAAIRAGVVVEFADVRRIWIKLGSPCITDVLIGTVAIAIEFEQSRYREVLPLRIIILDSKEVGRTLVVILHEVELPHTFHGKVVGRLLLVKVLRLIKVLVSKERSTTRLPVLLIDIHVLPARLALSRYAAAHGKHGKTK